MCSDGSCGAAFRADATCASLHLGAVCLLANRVERANMPVIFGVCPKSGLCHWTTNILAVASACKVSC